MAFNIPLSPQVSRMPTEAANLASTPEQQAEVAAVETDMRSMADERVTQLRSSATEVGRTALDSATEVTTEVARAIADIRSGRLSADDARRRLDQITTKLKLSRASADLFRHDANAIERIESDPLTYANELYAKYPSTRPRFNF